MNSLLLDNGQTVKVGDVVKYRIPADDDEKELRFTVIEITPEQFQYDEKPELGKIAAKLTVQLICDNYLKPINCFFAKEYEPV